MRWFLAFLLVSAAAADTATGRWVAPFSSDDEARQIVVGLTVDSAGHITGWVDAPQYQDRIVEGRASGSVLWFVGRRDTNNNVTRDYTYGGELAGNKLILFLPGNQAQRLEFTRASSQAPAPLPPPPPKVGLERLPAVRDNGAARTPPMGWNSWNKFRGKVNDQVVREIADAMVHSGMKDAGYLYVNIDDTWEGSRDPAGNITSNSKFPDMKALADYVHARGLKLGIYSSPGPKTCAGYEGSYRHEAQDARTWAAWGIDYLKYDWCSAARVYASDAATMQAAYARMGHALLDTARPIVYSLCQYGLLDVGEWGGYVGGNLWRTTGDIGDRWDSMSHIGFDLQPGREKYAEPGHWNDPDMLEIGNGGMSDIEYRTHMSLWCLLTAPLLAGNDLRTMSDSTRAILTNKEAIAIDQDPLGKQAVRVSETVGLEVWSRPLADGSHAVGLFNRTANPAPVTARFSDLGITGSHPVRDLWAHEDRGQAAGQFTAEVPPHGVILIKVSK